MPLKQQLRQKSQSRHQAPTPFPRHPHHTRYSLHPTESPTKQESDNDPDSNGGRWILSLLSSSPCPLPVDAAAGGQRQRRYRRQAEVLARPVREAVHVHADPARRSPVRLPAVESQRSRLRFGDVNSTGSSVASVVSNPPPPPERHNDRAQQGRRNPAIKVRRADTK